MKPNDKRLQQLLVDAQIELSQKSRKQIQEETTFKWGARAIAAYRAGLLIDSQDYYHEALEHAALADHSGEILRTLRAWIHTYIPHGAL